MADPADRAGVMVPVEDPLHRLAQQLAKQAAAGGAVSSKKEKKEKEKKEKEEKEKAEAPPSALKGKDKGKGGSKDKGKGGVSFGQDSYDPYDPYDPSGPAEYGVFSHVGESYGDEPDAEALYDLGDMGAGKMIAGVWMPALGAGAAAGNNTKENKQDGLGNDVNSSVWGRSKGTGKPVALPPRVAKTAIKSSHSGNASSDQSKNSDKSDKKKEKPKSMSMVDIQADQQLEAQEPARVRKDVLMKGLLGKMVLCHSIQHFQGAVPVYGTGPVPSVNIAIDTVRGNKQMTRLQGLEAFNVDLAQLAKGIQKKFASAASVGPQVTNPKFNEVCVQGNLAMQAEEFLCVQYGFRKSMINAPVGGGKSKGKKK